MENFPSASVGWRIDQESFMTSLKDVSELKLRAGYGITGLNVALGPVGANGRLSVIILGSGRTKQPVHLSLWQ